MFKIGQYQTLKIERETSVGQFLTNESGDEVLLPNKYVKTQSNVGELLDVFVYRDSMDRIVATSLRPNILINQFAYLRAKQQSQHGTFVDMGLEKDLLIPFKEQSGEMEVGKWYVVYMYLDTETDRLTGSTRFEKFLENEQIDLIEKQEVEAFVTGKSNLGWNVIINNQYKGLVYFSEVFKAIKAGDRIKAYIKTIREDHKIDVVIQKPGYEGVEPLTAGILDLLVQNRGFLPYTDKSDPDEISRVFGMSKKTFKKAIGSLYKQKHIRIEDTGFYLNE
jgi:predicted RNA-binding protein (virulence factor B family)